EITAFYKPWSRALVVRVLEKLFAFLTIKKRLEYLWAKSFHIQVADLSNDYFLVRFSEATDYQRAAFNGPWKIFDYYITMAQWTPDFNEEEPLTKLLTWVRLPQLPIHFFNTTTVTRIGNHIGRTIRLDLATAEGARARYARVCVEVDVSKLLLGKYMIGDRVFHVVYESLENLCHACRTYGHKADACPASASKTEETPTKQDPTNTSNKKTEEKKEAGSWMIVTRRRQGKSKPKGEEAATQTTGSRFVVLQRDQEQPVREGHSDFTKPSTGSDGLDEIAQLTSITAKVFSKEDNKGTPKGNAQARPPLGDKTNQPNKGSKPKGNVGKALGVGIPDRDELILVPVTYMNPTFEARINARVESEPKRVGCPKSDVPKGKRQENEKVLKMVNQGKIRNFKPQGTMKKLTKPEVALSEEEQINGRPPDGNF
ncbi:hypothetical protein LINPERHAP1_LOCUS23160, partial [Linum perenne]